MTYIQATPDVLAWESAFVKKMEKFSSDLKVEENKNKSLVLYYEAGRSYGDISGTSIFQDMDKLAVGIVLMFIYVLTILSNHNWVEWRVCFNCLIHKYDINL